MNVSMHAHGSEDRLRVEADIMVGLDDLHNPYSRVTIHGANSDVVTLYGFSPADLSAAGELLIVHAAKLAARIAAEMGGATPPAKGSAPDSEKGED